MHCGAFHVLRVLDVDFYLSNLMIIVKNFDTESIFSSLMECVKVNEFLVVRESHVVGNSRRLVVYYINPQNLSL